MSTSKETVRAFGFAAFSSVVALMQACAAAVGTQPQVEQPAIARAMPPAGYSLKWSTCTHFVEGEARILNNSRIVKIADDGTVPIMRVEPLDDSKDNVRRVVVAKLPYKGMLRGEGVLRDDTPRVGADLGSVKSAAPLSPTLVGEAEQKVSFLKLGQVVVTKERDGSFVQWVIASEDLGDPVMNKRTGKLEYQDTCFRNPKLAGKDTAGYIEDGMELAGTCVVEDMNQAYNALSVGGYVPLLNYVTMTVPTANDPSTRPHPDNLSTYHGYARGAFQYSGTGAALNDINGAERDASTVYFGGYNNCHMIVSDGLEVPGAKRPATKSLPFPGSVNEKTYDVWRPVNPNVVIANDEQPVAPPFAPEVAPLEPAPEPAMEPIEVAPI